MKASGREMAKRRRGLLLAGASLFAVLPLYARTKLMEHFREMKGTKGIVVRYCLLKSMAAECGDNVAILNDVYLFSPGLLSIGSNVSIHPMSYIDATGGMTIGSDVSLAHGVTIMSTTHVFTDPSTPFKEQGYEYKATSVGDDVWIGAKATVLAGVSIGRGVVVGANSVVTKDVGDYVVVAGSPAKVIRHRGSQ